MTRMGTTYLRPARVRTCLPSRIEGTAVPIHWPSGNLSGERKPRRTMALAFVQNSNYAYYSSPMTTAQSLIIPGRKHLARRCGLEPQTGPGCVPVPAQSPYAVDATALATVRPVSTRAVKRLLGPTAAPPCADCGPRVGGTTCRSPCCLWRRLFLRVGVGLAALYTRAPVPVRPPVPMTTIDPGAPARVR